jgi:small subunit ribosomal protein S6
MAKVTGNYETLYIVNSGVGEEGIAALVEKFKALAEEHGTLGEVNEWGNRRLAYPINDLLEGYYVLMTFSSDPSFPMELDRVFKITDGILRSIIICKDE